MEPPETPRDPSPHPHDLYLHPPSSVTRTQPSHRAMSQTLDDRALLERLVAFPTVSRDSNLPLIDWVEEYLTGWGAACRRTWSDCGTKANLLATFGPAVEGGVVLSGHTDVVPAEEPEWTSDPFLLTERDGRLYGRGTTDMKGFLASALTLAPVAAEARLQRPLHLALSYDEEVGCLGAPRMIRDMVEAGLRPEACIVGEPTLLRPAVAHKSVNGFRTRVRGVEAHSSQPHRGAGAIPAAGRLIEAIWRLGEGRRAVADSHSAFDPPWTTVGVGTIRGGTAVNILAGECVFTWEYRALPHEDQDELLRAFQAAVDEDVLPALREFAPEAGIETEVLCRVPPLQAESGGPDPETEVDGPASRGGGPRTGIRHRSEAGSYIRSPGTAEALVCRVLGEKTGARRVVSYGTEGGQFQAEGISTVICGPGSIDQAHRPNEYLEEGQLAACTAFLQGVLTTLEG